uniref:Uncharacterized protein LOC106760180 n=1 Tax=Rhizophora mucronata TaxID=61149 RepID=A0A2P2MW23_RHIMU
MPLIYITIFLTNFFSSFGCTKIFPFFVRAINLCTINFNKSCLFSNCNDMLKCEINLGGICFTTFF